MALKIFISYSHIDEAHINNFRKHTAPLKLNGMVSEWHDRRIMAGDEFHDTIDNNLDNADIICLFISSNFIASSVCIKEKDKAFLLKKSKGIAVIPIILSDCGWQDIDDLSKHLALPKDGQAITSYQNHDIGWKSVYDGLKVVIEYENKIRKVTIKEPFATFLNDAGLLANAHSKKETIFIDDIYVYPELQKYDYAGKNEKRIKSENLIDELFSNKKLIIAGENQAGKTTLCKKLFKEARKRNFFPVYVADPNLEFKGIIENKIKKSFEDQYQGISYNEIKKERIVPIVDDFHFASKKEKIISNLSSFKYQVLVVDEIFSLNLKNEEKIGSYSQLKIRQLSPSLRDELIRNWLNLEENKPTHANAAYKHIDAATEHVNSTLGKIISNGIMPAYPFFILSVLSTYEAFDRPLDQEITSQGHCYQALIYIYLRKYGVKNDEVDTYINFLSVISYHFFINKKSELSESDFQIFMEGYIKKFNLPVNIEIMLDILHKTKMLSVDSFGNYYFYYPYLYYYFVAKYLAEHLDQNKKYITEIISNLHKDENAYIAIFISHHTKSDYVLDEIVLNSLVLFDKYRPATLSKNELTFFDEKCDIITNAVLPDLTHNPESERAERLREQDLEEESKESSNNYEISRKDEATEDALSKDLRRSIKTVEVMGRIVKNRSGSLEKDRLEQIFREGMAVHLRILSSFIEIIRNESHQSEIESYIAVRLNNLIKDKEPKKFDNEKRQKYAKDLFWSMNFSVVYGFINKIINSLGSDKLRDIINKVCDEQKTPATMLIKHGNLMWYGKTIQVEGLASEIENDNFSRIAKRILDFMVVNHCSVHKVDYRDKQKIESRLGISAKRLLQLPQDVF